MPVDQDAPIGPPDASATQEELEARIDADLGIKPTKPAPAADDEVIPPAADEEDEPAAGDGDEDEPAVDEDEPAGDDEEDEPEPAEPATPSDEELFIEVQDADGVTHKISKIEDLPEDFKLKNDRQALEIMRQLDKLEAKMEKRDADKADAEAADAEETAKRDTFTAWDREIDNMVKEGRIDKIKAKAGSADYDKDPTVARINDAFGEMNRINAVREKAGNPNRITSIEDALDKLEAREAKEAKEAEAANGTQTAKDKSALIGGSGSGASSNEHKPYVAGSARSIDDIDV
jgi:hypothetical protein